MRPSATRRSRRGCPRETRSFADRPRGRGAIFDVRDHVLPTSRARFALPSGEEPPVDRGTHLPALPAQSLRASGEPVCGTRHAKHHSDLAHHASRWWVGCGRHDAGSPRQKIQSEKGHEQHPLRENSVWPLPAIVDGGGTRGMTVRRIAGRDYTDDDAGYDTS